MKPIYSLCLAGLCLALLFACEKKKEYRQTSASADSSKLKMLFQPLPSPDSSKALIDKLCLGRVMSSDQGKPIDSADATEKLRDYKRFMTLAAREAGYTYDPENDVYGLAFGIKSIDVMLTAIKRYNTKPGVDSVTGIRVYMGRAVHDGQQTADAFLMPVLKSGHNFYDIDPHFHKSALFPNEKRDRTDAPPMMNTSAPCPNRCP